MTRDELESRLWHWMPRAHPSVISAILADVDDYTTAETQRALAGGRRALEAWLDDTFGDRPPQDPREAHTAAERYRRYGVPIPPELAELEREYWRAGKRRLRAGAA